jgi:hypothetical protein
MRPIGFSTGALCKSDFATALAMLEKHSTPCVELSALRMHEVTPLLDALPSLDLHKYSKISFHAPGHFEKEDEAMLAQLLFDRVPASWPIVMHPDAIFDFAQWRTFGSRLAIENMDRRKLCGRNVKELRSIFAELPEASLCFDIGHARQFDSSMTEAFLLLTSFRERLVQVHISEVNSESQHDPISFGAKLSFQQVAEMIDETIPIIIESKVTEQELSKEIQNAKDALTAGEMKAKAEEMSGIFNRLNSLMDGLSSIGTKAAS